MSGKKGFGSTVLGWFVESEHPAESSADDLIQKYANEEPPPAPPPEVTLQGELPRPADGGAVNFEAVFKSASITDEQQDRVEKAMGLLRSLPAETPQAVKRQIVEASLKAFGYPLDQIIEAGVQEIQALEVYTKESQRRAQALVADGQKRIADLQAEIERVKQVMMDETTAQLGLEKSSSGRKLQVQEVLEFFGQEQVAKVVRESAKLHEPKAGPAAGVGGNPGATK